MRTVGRFSFFVMKKVLILKHTTIYETKVYKALLGQHENINLNDYQKLYQMNN